MITSKCGLMISLSVKNVGLLYTYVSGNDEFRKIIKLTTRKAITYPILLILKKAMEFVNGIYLEN